MPQMSPLYWSTISFFLLLLLMMNFSLIPGHNSEKMNKSNIYKKEKTMKW